MKKVLSFAVIILLFLTACNDGSNEKNIVTTLKIINNSGYVLYNVRYSSVNFNDIAIGANNKMNIAANSSNPIYFNLKINSNTIQCRTNEAYIFSENSSEEKIINNNTQVTAIDNNYSGTLNNVYTRLSKPILELSQNNKIINNNDPLPLDFGIIELNTNKQLIFTIKNIGNLPLELGGTPIILTSNPLFSIPSQPTNTMLNPGTSIAFLIQYTPIEEKVDTGTITIFNNSDDLVFVLNIKGNGHIKRPQIEIMQASTVINIHGEYNFDTVAIGEPKDVVFTILNSGDANLNFITTEGSRINLENNIGNHFSVIQPTTGTVIPNNQTTFTIRFNPTIEENNLAAAIVIKTNSRDNDEFSFNVKGNAYLKRPQITIKQGSTVINQNGEYNFGSVFFSEQKDIIFTIGNSGEANLVFDIIDNNCINLENNSQNHFSVITQPSATMFVAPGSTNSFTVRFKPMATGNNLSAIIKIKTNSNTNEDFTFALKGNSELAAPAGVTAVYQQSKSILISWNPVPGATSYNVYYGTSNNAISILAGNELTDTSFTHTGLSDGTTYYYCITAQNEERESARSQTVSRITPPGIPTNLRSTSSTHNSISLAWDTVTGAASYIIQRSITHNGVFAQIGTSTTTTYNDTNLSPSTTYYYKVVAQNASHNSEASDTLSEQTTAIPVPTNVTASAQSSSSIRITWNSISGASSYKIYRSSIVTGTYTQIGTNTTNNYTNTNLTPSTTYFYKVSMVTNTGAESDQSIYVSAATPAIAVPTNVTASAQSSSSIRISWTSVSEASSYRIYRSATASGTYTQIGTNTTNSYTNTNLTPSTAYFYKVSTVTNTGAESDQSVYVSANTPAIPVPTNLTASVQSAHIIYLSWSSVSEASSYRIYRSATATGTYIQIGTSNTSNFTNTGLTASTTYYYKVSIITSSGVEGTQSAHISASTPAVPVLQPPANIEAFPVNNGIRIIWDAVSNAQGYTVYRSTSASGTYSTVVTNTSNTTFLNSTSGTTTYYYKVATVNSAGVAGTQSAAVSSPGPGTLITLPYYSDPNTYYRDSITATQTKYYRFQPPAGRYIYYAYADRYDNWVSFTPALTGSINLFLSFEDGDDDIYSNPFYSDYSGRAVIFKVTANQAGTFVLKWWY